MRATLLRYYRQYRSHLALSEVMSLSKAGNGVKPLAPLLPLYPQMRLSVSDGTLMPLTEVQESPMERGMATEGEVGIHADTLTY